MQALFSPAIAVMNRLSYSKKFVVLGFLSMLAVLVVLFNLYQNLHRVIADSQCELDGLAQIKAVTQAIQVVQQHRGLSTAVMGGIETLRDEMLSREQASSQALAAVEHTLATAPTIINTYNDIKDRWSQIQQNKTQLSLEANYSVHTQLIEQMLELQIFISDEALLTTDPVLDSYHLIILLTKDLPDMLENIGRLRAYTLVILAQHHISPEQKLQISGLKISIEQALTKINAVIENTSRYNPNLKPILDTTLDNIGNATHLISQQIVPDIVQENFATDPEYLYTTITQALNTAYLQIYDIFLPTTEKLLNTRIAHAWQTLWLSLGIPGGLFLLIIYFAIGAHISVSSGIVALADAVKAYSTGDLRRRLPVYSRDEIGLMTDSFNRLADSFDALLELRKNDQIRLQSIIDTALDAVLQMDAQGVLNGWNRQAEQIFGWSAAEVCDRFLHEIIIPERFRPAHQQGLKHYLETGEGAVLNKRIEIMALHRDGHEFPIELAITPNCLQHSVEFSAFIRDISLKKQTLQTLQNSEHRYRTLFESSRDALMTLSPIRGFLSGNPATIRLFACHDEQEFLAQTVESLSPARQADGQLSAELAQQKIEFALANGSNTFEWLHRKLNGETFFAEIQLSRVEIDQDIVLQASVRDISESKQARAALVASEARTRAVLRNMSDVVVLIDTQGNILQVNDAINELFGYQENELLGRNVNLLMPEPYASAHDNYLRLHTETKNHPVIGRRLELEGKRKDGSLIPIELSVNELIDDLGTTYIGVMRDISHHKAIEQARETARLEAVNLAHAKSAFLANMSHEIRTPLNAIIGLSAMSSRDSHEPGLQENSMRIHAAGLHLLSVVNDILDFSKIEAGKMNLDLQPFRLRGLLDDAVNLVNLRAKEKMLDLQVEYPDDLPEWILGDPLRLRQILVNLLSNAIKFTEHGSVKLAVRRQQHNTEISVTDTGIGLAPEQIARLFTAFEQADNSTTRKFGGSGLGLVISRNLAKLMDGDIIVKSTAGVGSQFTLNLPLPATTAGAAHQIINRTNGGRLQGINILAAEDVPLNRLVLEDLLIHEGAHVVFAENGQQALDQLAAAAYSGFDIVLMDIQMPVMDGYQATRLLLNRAPELPVIGLTAHAMPEDRQRCLEAGMRERITKPIDANELVETILTHLPFRVDQSFTPRLDRTALPCREEELLAPALIDWPAVQQRYDGRQAFIDKLIANTLDGSQQAQIDKLRMAVAQQDLANIRFIAHSLKGLANVFETQILLDQAMQTEQAAKNESDTAFMLGTQLADTLQNVLVELQQHQQS